MSNTPYNAASLRPSTAPDTQALPDHHSEACALRRALAAVGAPADHPWASTHVEVDVLMSTAHTVVVGARVQLLGDAQWHDIEVVVPRHACRGNRPSVAALLKATSHGLRRLRGVGRRGRLAVLQLSALIDGRWQAVLAQGQGWIESGALAHG